MAGWMILSEWYWLKQANKSLSKEEGRDFLATWFASENDPWFSEESMKMIFDYNNRYHL